MDFYHHLQSKGMISKPEDIAPNVEPFVFYIEAFHELSSCRPSGWGISPIPFTSIVEYAKIYEVGDFNEFLDIMRIMDAELIRLENDKQKKQGNESKHAKRN
jgi:hypothetical protein